MTLAQRRPEVIPGYEPTSAMGRRRIAALNEGRRLSPATSAWKTPSGPSGLVVAQRRPEVIPGYEPGAGRHRAAVGPSAQRRPEVIPGYEVGRHAAYRDAGGGRSTKAGGYPRLRALLPAGRPEAAGDRSTKAGGYPRLRAAGSSSCRGSPSALNEGRRLSPATSRTLRSAFFRFTLFFAQRRPEVIPGYEPGAMGEVAAVAVRSTKAGGYPRLRVLIRGDSRLRAENGFD